MIRHLDRLATCDLELIRLFSEVGKTNNITIICGFRDQAAQDLAFASGASKEQWPDGKHDRRPSQAVDVGPDPICFGDIEAFKNLAVIVKDTARRLNIGVKWGGDYLHLHDYPHWELI